jgi:hypothetical protein
MYQTPPRLRANEGAKELCREFKRSFKENLQKYFEESKQQLKHWLYPFLRSKPKQNSMVGAANL